MQAYNAALELMTHIVPPVSMSPQSSTVVREEVGKTARKVTELWLDELALPPVQSSRRQLLSMLTSKPA
jgi:hypothetical protein